MFTIRDAPDPAPIEAWIKRCIDTPLDDRLVLMTGEGLRRLMKVVRRIGLEPEFITAIGKAASRARSQTRTGAARNRAGAAGDDREADLESIAEMLSLDLRGHRLGRSIRTRITAS